MSRRRCRCCKASSLFLAFHELMRLHGTQHAATAAVTGCCCRTAAGACRLQPPSQGFGLGLRQRRRACQLRGGTGGGRWAARQLAAVAAARPRPRAVPELLCAHPALRLAVACVTGVRAGLGRRLRALSHSRSCGPRWQWCGLPSRSSAPAPRSGAPAARARRQSTVTASTAVLEAMTHGLTACVVASPIAIGNLNS